MTSDPAPQTKRVFLVDDHPLVREWLTNLINQQPGLEVCGEAESGPEARERILALRPDVAIVDIALKDSSGIELIKDLKQSCPEVAVLVLSMHEDSHYAERALRAGARGYVMKRETTRKVIAAINQVLAGKLCVSETLTAAMAAHFVEGKTLATRTPVEQLSDRELEVFELLGQGRGKLLRRSTSASRRSKLTARGSKRNSIWAAPLNCCGKLSVGTRTRFAADCAVVLGPTKELGAAQ